MTITQKKAQPLHPLAQDCLTQKRTLSFFHAHEGKILITLETRHEKGLNFSLLSWRRVLLQGESEGENGMSRHGRVTFARFRLMG